MTDEDWQKLMLQLPQLISGQGPGSRGAPSSDEQWRIARELLYGVARQVADPADADDVVQSILLRLQQPATLRRFLASRSPKGYATVMVRNAAIDAMRRKRRWVPVSEDLIWIEDSPEAVLQEVERQSAIRAALRQLSDSDRELLRMRFWSEMSIADIARKLNEPYSTVAVRMFRLLARLRVQLPQAAPAGGDKS